MAAVAVIGMMCRCGVLCAGRTKPRSGRVETHSQQSLSNCHYSKNPALLNLSCPTFHVRSITLQLSTWRSRHSPKQPIPPATSRSILSTCPATKAGTKVSVWVYATISPVTHSRTLVRQGGPIMFGLWGQGERRLGHRDDVTWRSSLLGEH